MGNFLLYAFLSYTIIFHFHGYLSLKPTHNQPLAVKVAPLAKERRALLLVSRSEAKRIMPELDNAIEQSAKELLKSVIDINAGKSLVAMKAVKAIKFAEGALEVNIALGYPAKSYISALEETVKNKLKELPDVQQVQVSVQCDIASFSVQKNLKPLQNIKNIIAIASGKGGVGKSTTAVNLALALDAEGAKTGLLDADIYGPSQPSMLGIAGQPESKDEKTLEPIEKYNLQVMSIGFLIDKETPMIWRGPMVTQALQQLLSDTNWHNLDYLIIDLPPGTGDIQLTLAQKIPVSGALIVTTPQEIALLDARKGIRMFEKVDVPILGVIENMSTHVCSQCGHEEHIFGAGGGQRIAKDYNTELLGSLPLDLTIREQVDGGKPTVVAAPDSAASGTYLTIARKAAAKLSSQSKDYQSKFPKIVIQNT